VSQEVNPEHRWISVEERLPDENEIVIIKAGGGNGGVGCLIGRKWRSQLGIDSGRPVEWTVTHWMPQTITWEITFQWQQACALIWVS
jgi:hypothetical protein